MSAPPGVVPLRLRPSTKHEANEHIAAHHRHHGRVQGLLFAIACETLDGQLVGVVVVGRPGSRVLQARGWAEVTRLCVLEGYPNAASMLLGRARRAAAALCYPRLVTYTHADEGGASLRAAGWQPTGQRTRGSWSTPARPRGEAERVARVRWERDVG